MRPSVTHTAIIAAVALSACNNGFIRFPVGDPPPTVVPTDDPPPDDTWVDDTGFGPDTCNPGDTLGEPIDVYWAPIDSIGVWIDFGVPTGPGADLPDEYFAEVYVLDDADGAVYSAGYLGDRTFDIRLNSVPFDELTFVLGLPDRREWTGCTHHGMDDVYKIEVTVQAADLGSIDATVYQSVDYGDI